MTARPANATTARSCPTVAQGEQADGGHRWFDCHSSPNAGRNLGVQPRAIPCGSLRTGAGLRFAFPAGPAQQRWRTILGRDLKREFGTIAFPVWI